MLSTSRQLRPPFLVDNFMVLITATLVCFSIIMVYSTTGVISQERFGDSLYYVKRQVVAAIIGMALLVAFSRIKPTLLCRLSLMALPTTILLLALTLIPGLAVASGGARRWVDLGFIVFQPGELAKVSMAVFIAGYLGRHEAKLSTISYGVVRPLIFVASVSVFFLMQPDFGSTVVLLLVCLGMALVAGARLKHIMASLMFGAVCGLVLIAISPYRVKRIASFLAPLSDVSGQGYQLVQSLIAIGSGQIGGVGLGGSSQKLFFLPAAHTDFIFSVIAEELGFIGCLILIAFFITFMWRGFVLSGKLAHDTFAFTLSAGLTLIIVVPALTNIGVVTGLLPTKGMVLPLVGYGGSNLVACLAAVGLLLALQRTGNEQIAGQVKR